MVCRELVRESPRTRVEGETSPQEGDKNLPAPGVKLRPVTYSPPSLAKGLRSLPGNAEEELVDDFVQLPE